MAFVLFQDNLEDKTENVLAELGIKSVITLEGKKGRIYVLRDEQLKWLEDSEIKYRVLPENNIEKYLTGKGLLYLRSIRTNFSL